MPVEPFGSTQSGASLSDDQARGRGQPLVCDGLQELSDPQSTGVSGRAPRWKYVVRADDLVTIGDVGFRSEEQGAVVPETVEIELHVLRQHFDMLRRDLVGDANRLFIVLDEDDSAVIRPRDAGNAGGGEDRK